MLSMDTLKVDKYDSDWSWLNAMLVAATVGCGVKGYQQKDKDKRQLWFLGAGCLYTTQFIESFFSNTFRCTWNIWTRNEAINKIERMRASKPECDISIFNYHYETRKADCSTEKREYKRIKAGVKANKAGFSHQQLRDAKTKYHYMKK